MIVYSGGPARYLQVLPLILLIVLLTIFPTLFAYYISTQRVRLTQLDNAQFVGLNNFGDTLGDK